MNKQSQVLTIPMHLDWERVLELRVTRKCLDALKNLDITALYLTRANRRGEGRLANLGYASEEKMLEAETTFGLSDPSRLYTFLARFPDAVIRLGQDRLKMIEKSIQGRRLVLAQDHSGMCQILCPVMVGEKIEGMLRLGEFVSGTRDDATAGKIKAALAYLPCTEAEVDQALVDLPYFSTDKVAIISNLLEMMAEEIGGYQEEVIHEQQAATGVRDADHGGIISRDAAILEIIKQLKMVSQSDSSVIIYGESGTGKELIAKLIHKNSKRKDKQLVTINCAALTETLLEAELFGYKKGAFTGAISDRKGLFEVADGGTVFLDEVGEMSLALQVKILRLIQEGTFMRVGDTETQQVNVRVISATHRDLKRMIQEGKFREDLYYRLAVVELSLPPLRDRGQDIPLLVTHFLEQFQEKVGKQGIKFSAEAMEVFGQYYWPGNVRELSNEVERIVALMPSHSLIKPKDLSKKFFYEQYPEEFGDAEKEGMIKSMVEDYEKSLLMKYLRKHHWNRTAVARLCGITRQGLNKKINKYQLDRRRG